MRFGYGLDAVLSFMGVDIAVSVLDFFMMGDAKAVMVVMRLVGCVGSVFMNHEQPIGVGVLNDRLVVFPLNHFGGEQIGENGQGFVEGMVLIMAMNESDRLKHDSF